MMTRELTRRVALMLSLVASATALNSSGAQAAPAAPAAPAAAQSSPLIGRWEGSLYVQGNQIPVVITLDSVASGWTGSLLVAQLNPNAIGMASVVIKKDTVSMQLPEEGMNAFLQGLLSADKKTLNGLVAVNGDNSSSFQVTKVGVAAKPAPGAPKHH